jgi:hypothetical protein
LYAVAIAVAAVLLKTQTGAAAASVCLSDSMQLAAGILACLLVG